MRKFVSRENKVRAITAFHKKFESTLEKADATVDRVYKAFENPKNTYTKSQLSSIVTAFDKLSDVVVRGIKSSFVNLRVAVRGSIPTDRVVAHIEDGHTLLSKIAIMKAQALASIKAEDVTIDEAGYLVGDEDGAEAPAEGDAAPDADGDEAEAETPQDKIEDIKQDLDELAAELGGGEAPEADADLDADAPPADEPPAEEPKAASKKSTKMLKVKEAADTSPGKAPERIADQPKDNPKIDEETAESLESKFEKEPNIKKGSKDTSPGKAPERIPDQPKANPDADEEELSDLVDEFEKNPSDPENLEMEDSMIDDAVNVEILSDGDTDELEEEVTKASASLRDRKIASSKKVAAVTSENDVLKTIISDMF